MKSKISNTKSLSSSGTSSHLSLDSSTEESDNDSPDNLIKKRNDDLNAESNDESGSSYHPSDSSSCIVKNEKKIKT